MCTQRSDHVPKLLLPRPDWSEDAAREFDTELVCTRPRATDHCAALHDLNFVFVISHATVTLITICCKQGSISYRL